MTTFLQGVCRSIEHLEKFLRLSLNALNYNDREIYSQAVVLLTKNLGNKIMRLIMEAIANPQGDRPLKDLDFNKHIVPFTKIIAHDKFSLKSFKKYSVISCVVANFLNGLLRCFGERHMKQPLTLPKHSSKRSIIVSVEFCNI